eukprot:scaffold2533_cov137-Cylindrotheca_fusiformis.AAC.22
MDAPHPTIFAAECQRIYVLKFLVRPGRLCPEPDCSTDVEHHLCRWYDCTSSSSRRFLEAAGNGKCTFFGSEVSCEGDSICLSACKELNDGICPQCISFYPGGTCQDSVAFSSSNLSSLLSGSSSSGARDSGNISNGNFIFGYALTGIVLVGAVVVIFVKCRKSKCGLLADGYPLGRGGIIRSRIDAAEGGNIESISTVEDKTNVIRSQPDSIDV